MHRTSCLCLGTAGSGLGTTRPVTHLGTLHQPVGCTRTATATVAVTAEAAAVGGSCLLLESIQVLVV
jgi:hypothetical protein